MQHAQQQTIPLTRTMLGPIVALVIGVAGAAGVYVLVDDDGGTKTESGAAAIGRGVAPTDTKDEAAIAAAVGNPGASASGQTKDESAIAAAVASSRESELSQEAERAKRTDPHGPASALP